MMTVSLNDFLNLSKFVVLYFTPAASFCQLDNSNCLVFMLNVYIFNIVVGISIFAKIRQNDAMITNKI